MQNMNATAVKNADYELLTPKKLVKRAGIDGISVTENAVRSWLAQDLIFHVKSGNRNYIPYCKFLEFIGYDSTNEPS